MGGQLTERSRIIEDREIIVLKSREPVNLKPILRGVVAGFAATTIIVMGVRLRTNFNDNLREMRIISTQETTVIQKINDRENRDLAAIYRSRKVPGEVAAPRLHASPQWIKYEGDQNEIGQVFTAYRNAMKRFGLATLVNGDKTEGRWRIDSQFKGELAQIARKFGDRKAAAVAHE